MHKNETLEKVCAELAEQKQQWEEMVDRFQSHPRYGEKELKLHRYIHHFGELWLHICLERIAEESDGKIKVVGDGSDGWTKGGYRFKVSENGSIYVAEAQEQDENLYIQHYDKVMIVDSLPTVFEVKISKNWKTHSGKPMGAATSSLGIRAHFKKDKYVRKLGPIRKNFRRDVGYVLVIPKDIYCLKERTLTAESDYSQFKANKGLVVPFYTDARSFGSECMEKLLEYGIVQPPGTQIQ